MQVAALNLVLCGAIAAGSAVAGMFFFRFWRHGGDRFFFLFAMSFFVEAANRVALALSGHPNEGAPIFYGIRLLAYLLIIAAIVDKNRVERKRH